MEVDDRVSQQILDNGDDDDDGPMVFKRNNPPSKQSQFGSASKNILEKHETSSGRPVSVRSPNGENMYSRRNKVASTSKSVTDRFTAASTRTLTSKPSASKSQSDRLDKSLDKSSGKPAISDDSDDDKPLSFKIPGASTANRKSTYLPLNKPKEESDASDDSDDDKPLSFRVTTNSGLQKSNSLPAKKLFNSQNPSSSLTKKKNDLQDGKLTSSKSPGKSGIGSPTTKSFDSDEEKPLSAVLHKNASCKSEPGSTGKTITDSNKRHLANANNSVQSPNKKARASDTPEYAKVKQESTLEKEMKTRDSDDDDDYVPLAQRTKKTAFSNNDLSAKKALKKVVHKSFKKEDKKRKKGFKNNNYSKPSKVPPGSGEGQKWTTLEHSGVIFPPPYKPHGVKMLYNGQPVDLTPEQEEVATMFAVMKDTDYASKKTFIDNFMSDWRTILGKNHVIKKFELCDFSPIYEWHLKEKEKKKQMTAAEKKAIKEEKLKQEEKYMWAIVDGVKEKVGNFRVEPPGLFRGRGEHPKMGKLKKRIRPRDITINIGKGVPVPECPIPGERWKEVKHDNTVTWLAFWNDPINPKEFKYVFLAASSSLKGQSDKEKYEKARKLKDYIRNIRATYTKDFTSKDEMKRQIAVATYLIDKLALRAGNEKDDDEADTVGCCTLKVENVTLVPPNKLQFDFLGKDSIRYFNTVEVELQVYKAIGEFRKGGKKGSDDLFDKLDTSKLNAHLKELMPGLTAKVFRTYNASITLDEMLNKETEDGTLPEKIAVYQRANKEVAIICNHQRSVSKSHDAQMLRLNEKIEELKAQQKELEVDLDRARRGKPPLKDAEGKTKRNLAPEAIEKKLSQTSAKIEKMELDKKIKEDLKTVALGTSKINYLDPRISVAWCKRLEVPIEKIFNKSLLAKFAWAMDVDPSFRF